MRNLLIVDDDCAVCASLEKLLRAEGFNVITAFNAAEAIEQYKAKPVDLVVLDVNLGNDDGWDVFKRMEQIDPAVPTIIITAEWSQHARAVALGVEALIEKPIDVPSFLEVVNELLALKAANGICRMRNSDRYCRYRARDYETPLRALQERCSAPLELSAEMLAAASSASDTGKPEMPCAPGDPFAR